MSVVRQVRTLLSSEQPDEQSPDEPQTTTRLYRCDPCGVTFIANEMERCASCEGPVETTPSERDLGFI